MAQIQEYDPQVEASGPVGAVSPNLEEAASVGNAISRVGSAAEQAGDVIYRRDSQKETTQAYSWSAGKRADYYGQIQDGIQSGNLDSEKLLQQFQSDASQESDNYSTAAGKNYFNRQVARLQSSLTQKAGAAQAHISGQQVTNAADEATQNGRAAVWQDPSQLADTLASGYEYLDTQSSENGGPLNPSQIAQARKNMASDYAMTAIQSTAQMSPDNAKAALNSGYFAKIFTPDEFQKAQRIVENAQTASGVQYKADQKAQSDQAQAQDDALKGQFLKKAYGVGGQFNAKDVLNSSLSPEDQKWVLTAANAAQQQQLEKRPAVLQKTMQNILSPDNAPGHIGSEDQLMKMVATGQINAAEHATASQWLGKDPATKDLNASRKLVMDQANKQLGSAMLGATAIKDPDGPYKVNMFMHEVMAKEQEYNQQGKTTKTLFDPTQPDYVGKLISKYKSSAQDIMMRQADQLRMAPISPQGTPMPMQIETAPGVPVQPPSTPTAKIPAGVKARAPGESPADFIKRTRGGK